MTKVTDALNQQYVFTYDPLGRQLTQTRAGATMTYEYDAVGNRIKRTDYLNRVTDYTYDNLNRLTYIDYVGGSSNAAYGYDDLSRLTSAVNYTGTVSFTYDNRSRIKTTTDVFGRVLEYDYDGNNNRTQLKLDNVVHTGYGYDAANRLRTLTNKANQNYIFDYDDADRLISKTLPNTITTTYDYDGMSRLKRLKHQKAATILFDNNYAYNPANQISQIAELAQTKNFGYDNLDRLTSVTNPTQAVETYNFDAVGNRTTSHLSASYTHQANNRLTGAQGVAYTYDANGNPATRTDAAGGINLSWDYENRLTNAERGSFGQADNVLVYNHYDALGRRVRRHQIYYPGYSYSESFTYDGQDVVTERSPGFQGSEWITEYQNGLGIDEKLEMQRTFVEGEGDIIFLRQQTSGRTPTSSEPARYFLADHLGSTIALTDESGAVESSASYDGFGRATGNLATRYQYTGREFDSFTGLYYYRARWYDSQIGRFISEDPIGFAGGDVNLYAYVGNNPVSKTDPLGETEEDMIWRLQHYQDPATRKDVAKWDACLSKCLLTYGVGEALGFAGFAFGQPLMPKSVVRPNETGATSPISKWLSEKFPQKLPKSLFPSGAWAPTGSPLEGKFWTRRTRSLGRTIGRWVPIASAGLIIGDFFWIRSCANECYDGECGK